MLDKPKSCKGCPLMDIGKGFINPEGTGVNGVMITGESAGYNEILDGLPFRPNAQAGSVLQRVINMTKFSRSQFIINNLCMCRPPQDKLNGASYEVGAISHCRDAYYDDTVRRFKPKVIVASGALAFRYLTGLEGNGLNIQQVRGYVFNM